MPCINACRVARAIVLLLKAVLGILKKKCHHVPFIATIDMDHDIVRHVFQGKGQESPDCKFMLYEKNDFERFKMPFYWHYYLDELGQGIVLKFPLGNKTKLSFVEKCFYC